MISNFVFFKKLIFNIRLLNWDGSASLLAHVTHISRILLFRLTLKDDAADESASFRDVRSNKQGGFSILQINKAPSDEDI